MLSHGEAFARATDAREDVQRGDASNQSAVSRSLSLSRFCLAPSSSLSLSLSFPLAHSLWRFLDRNHHTVCAASDRERERDSERTLSGPEPEHDNEFASRTFRPGNWSRVLPHDVVVEQKCLC